MKGYKREFRRHRRLGALLLGIGLFTTSVLGNGIEAKAAVLDVRQWPSLSGVGADLPFVQMEAEEANTNGEVLGYSTSYIADIQSEASGRKAVRLDATGEYVEFTLTESADCMVVRYCMPDGNNGAGLDATLSLYINGNHRSDLYVSSRHAWVYGPYDLQYSNDPSVGYAHRFFDDIKVHFGQTYNAGTKIRLQKDSGDTAGYYIIDLIDFEMSGNVISQPSNFLSIADYGAVPNDNVDDYNAIVNCISDAKNWGMGVYMPAGTYNLMSKRAIDVSDITIQGAGMWHTTLYGAGAAFNVSGTCQFSDFAMTGVSTIRDDSGDLAGFEGYQASNNVLIQNVWMEHMKVGCWFYNSTGLTVQGCRIRNTYADGLNLCSNVHNAVIQNNHFRNTGDDSIAIWPWQGDSNNNTIHYNTVQCPTLASCVAIYGGGGNRVSNNYLADTITYGAGVGINTLFDTPNGFVGETVVSYNTLVRCGSYEHGLNYERGSIWIYAANRPVTAGVTVYNNSVYDSVYSGITIDGGQQIGNVNFSNNYFYGVNRHGIHVRNGAYGNVVLDNNYAERINGQTISNESSQLSITQYNGGINISGGSGASGGIVSGAKYRIVSRQSNKCLDVEGGNSSAGANVLQWENNGGINQQWYLNQNSDGSYTVLSALSGMAIDVEGGSTSNGGNVIVWNSNGQDNQKWWITDMGNGYYSIVSKNSGKSIDVEGNSTDNGGNVLQWDYHGGTNQQWMLERVY